MKEYFVYMLANKYHSVLYIGFTNNIRRRVYEHKRKLVYGFTSKYNCNILVWYEVFADVNLAIAREKQLKVWQRSWKNNLIEKHNPDWHDLAADWFVKLGK
ncbi:putative endonuclease [Daejeonella rubra]|uniref:Putative endonuclease n=1 Tax=Daejeonella rubra TaxID=990371 RepID=A0A1G9YD40_9SPHI|nr:GIY-YIG nuclease family protein [Daejeonella rubra]SDN07078.1 putative endonuclease [Daejeonella rubra]